jgi:hypothetical protein
VKVKTDQTMICDTNLADDASGRKTRHGGSSNSIGSHEFATRTTDGTRIGAVDTVEKPAAVEIRLDARPGVQAR